jgi:hypothetical protein
VESFGDYIIYADESGDHALAKTDPTYPMFVLAFCVVRQDEYTARIVPAIQRIKFKHFGHDMVVLHEHEIRKAKGPFAFLTDAGRRKVFMEDLNEVVVGSPFGVVAVCIHKDKLKNVGAPASNPYDLALGLGLEMLDECLMGKGQAGKITHVVFEARGKKEDEQLELEFRRVCHGANRFKAKLDFRFVLADKKVNSCGLQLADLIARPIGLKSLRPAQPNRAFDVIESKFERDPANKAESWGLKCVP